MAQWSQSASQNEVRAFFFPPSVCAQYSAAGATGPLCWSATHHSLPGRAWLARLLILLMMPGQDVVSSTAIGRAVNSGEERKGKGQRRRGRDQRDESVCPGRHDGDARQKELALAGWLAG